MKERSLIGVTLILSLTGVLSTILGFARESLIAFLYGANAGTDAYFIATTIIDLFSVWIAGSVTTTLIPIAKREILSNEGSARRFMQSLMWYSGIVFVGISFCVWLFAPTLTHIFAPGISEHEGFIVIQMLRISSISILFSGVSGVLWGIYNVNERYFIPPLAALLYNVVYLIFMIVAARSSGVLVLAYAYLLSNISKFIMQLLPLLYNKLYNFKVVWYHRSISSFIRNFLFVTFSGAVGYTAFIVDRILASELSAGEITDYSYAVKFALSSVTILSASLSSATYTRFVEYNYEGNVDMFKLLLQNILSVMLFLAVVVGVQFIFFSNDWIRLLFRHGHFTVADALLTSRPVVVVGFTSLFYLLVGILSRYFSAIQANKFILLQTALSVFVNIILSIVLVKPLNITGLMIANSSSQIIAVLIMMWKIKRDLFFKYRDIIIPSLISGLPASLLIALVQVTSLWICKVLWHLELVPLQLLINIVLGSFALFVWCKLSPKNLISTLVMAILSRLLYGIKYSYLIVFRTRSV